jgi:hypothetical protein
MAAVQRSEIAPAQAPKASQFDPPGPAPAELRAAGDGDIGAPNPALQAQRERIAEFTAEAPEPYVEPYSPRVRLAILVVAVAIPWLFIGLTVKALLSAF